jgi:hypothetical protein
MDDKSNQPTLEEQVRTLQEQFLASQEEARADRAEAKAVRIASEQRALADHAEAKAAREVAKADRIASEQRVEAYRSHHPSRSNSKHPSRISSPVRTEMVVDTGTIPPNLGKSQDVRRQDTRLTPEELNLNPDGPFARPLARQPVKVMGDTGRDQFRDNTSSSNHSDDSQIQENHSNDRQHRNVQHNNDAEDLKEVVWQNQTIYRSDNDRQNRKSLGQQKSEDNTTRSKKYESDAKALERDPLNRQQIVTIQEQLAYKVIDFYKDKGAILNNLTVVEYVPWDTATSSYVRRYKPAYDSTGTILWDQRFVHCSTPSISVLSTVF